MDPTTDKVSFITTSDGRTVEIRQPGALTKPSSNWRLNEAAFQRYRDHLWTAVSNWPQETEFSVPSGLSPNTFVARFRDARQACLQFGYDPELQKRLLEIGDGVAISLDPSGKSVWFRERATAGRQRKHSVKVEHVRRPFCDASEVQPLPSRDELLALCLLLKAGRIQPPLHFSGRIDPSLIEEVESKYDVAFAFDDITSITTLV